MPSEPRMADDDHPAMRAYRGGPDRAGDGLVASRLDDPAVRRYQLDLMLRYSKLTLREERRRGRMTDAERARLHRGIRSVLHRALDLAAGEIAALRRRVAELERTIEGGG